MELDVAVATALRFEVVVLLDPPLPPEVLLGGASAALTRMVAPERLAPESTLVVASESTVVVAVELLSATTPPFVDVAVEVALVPVWDWTSNVPNGAERVESAPTSTSAGLVNVVVAKASAPTPTPPASPVAVADVEPVEVAVTLKFPTAAVIEAPGAMNVKVLTLSAASEVASS